MLSPGFGYFGSWQTMVLDMDQSCQCLVLDDFCLLWLNAGMSRLGVCWSSAGVCPGGCVASRVSGGCGISATRQGRCDVQLSQLRLAYSAGPKVLQPLRKSTPECCARTALWCLPASATLAITAGN